MKVFVAGATGAIGRPLVRKLVAGGHAVVGMTRSQEKAGDLRGAGAEPAICDALDAEAVRAAVEAARPDVVIHQLTAIPDRVDIRHFDREFARTNRLRTEGTDHLVAAARAAGVRRIVAQSFGAWTYARDGGPVKTEEDRLDPSPPPAFRDTLDAIRHLEAAVLGAEGVEGLVLRYGWFYGPGTSIGPGGSNLEEVRRRRLPIVGKGTGVWSFAHIDDAAAAAVAAAERGMPGIYNIADDEPAPVAEWVPALAAAIGAKPPWRVPALLARLLVGEAGITMMTDIRGMSNAKARRELAWEPAWPTWREGFRRGLDARRG